MRCLMPELKRRRIYFDDNQYEQLVEVNRLTGDSFSEIIGKLIGDDLEDKYVLLIQKELDDE